MPAFYISIDEQKKLIAGYAPERAGEFYAESAKIADTIFMRALNVDPSRTVILLSGGSASGKTEFYSEYLADEPAIVFDSTLPTAVGAKIKLRMIEKTKKTPIVYAILPDDLTRAFAAFLGRDRRFEPEHFYRTHAGARKTLLWIATHCPQVDIRIFESSFREHGVLRFRPIEWEHQQSLIEFLRKIQYTERQIAEITNAL